MYAGIPRKLNSMFSINKGINKQVFRIQLICYWSWIHILYQIFITIKNLGSKIHNGDGLQKFWSTYSHTYSSVGARGRQDRSGKIIKE